MSYCDWVVDKSGPYMRGSFDVCANGAHYSTRNGLKLCSLHQQKIVTHVADMIESDDIRLGELDELLEALVKRTRLNARGSNPEWAHHQDAIDAEITRRVESGDAPSLAASLDVLIEERLAQKWSAA